MATQGHNADFSSFPITRPVTVGGALPAACVIGQLFFNTSVAAGGNLFGCAQTNTWTPFGLIPPATSNSIGGVTVPSNSGLVISSGALSVAYGTGSNTALQGNTLGQPYGAASLDANGKVPTAQLGNLGSAAFLNSSAFDIAGAASSVVAAIPHSSSTTTQPALITSSDWATFNAKQPPLGFTPENSANKNAKNGYAGLDSAGFFPWAQLDGIVTASSSKAGILSSSDWNTFNSKQTALGFTPENSANRGIANGYAALNASAQLVPSELPNGLIYSNQANSYAAGSKQSVQASSATAGFNVGGVPSDPTNLASGDLWFNTALGQLSLQSANQTQRILTSTMSYAGLGQLLPDGYVNNFESQTNTKTTVPSYLWSNVIAHGVDQQLLDGGININRYSGKTQQDAIFLNGKGYTPGELVPLYSTAFKYSVGDTLGVQSNVTCYGGFTAAGDEGCETFDGWSLQGQVQLTSTIATGGTGAVSVTIANPTAGAGTQGAGRALLDTQTPTNSGSITAITYTNSTTPLVYTGTGTSWSASTVSTTLGTAVTTPGTIMVTPGSMTGISVGSILVVADQYEYETISVSSTTANAFTATFKKPHLASAIVAGGGLSGYWCKLDADDATPGMFPQLTNTLNWAFPVISSSATQLNIWYQNPNSGYIAYNGRWNASNQTYACYPGAEVYSVQSSGALSNTFTLAPNSVTWTNGDSVIMPLYPVYNGQFGHILVWKWFQSAGGTSAAVLPIEMDGLWGYRRIC